MFSHSSICSGAKFVARFIPIVLVLCLFGCGGASPRSNIVPPPNKGQINANSFGFQCATQAGGCPDNGTDYTWPTTQAQPGCIRLWDASVEWNVLNTGNGAYTWNDMDKWLDTIAGETAVHPVCAIYTFGWVPFWDAPTSGTCQTASTRGSGCPPVDLTPTGSATFDAFVTALVAHCSPNNNCVSTYIKYWELWNEPDTPIAWTGTVQQMYQMLKPVVPIIQAGVPGAQLMGPTVSDNASSSVSWATSFLQQEVSTGVLSNIYSFHVYLQNKTPETVITAANGGTNNGVLAQLSSDMSTSGWTQQPWWITETNFANSSQPNPYTCDTTQFSADDCTGQIVRWQLLINSNGGFNVTWYSWVPTIGSVPQYETAYYYMMQYMDGGTFPGPCTSTSNSSIQTWTCDFTEGNGTTAQWVWTPTEAGTTFTVPSGYTDYRDLTGATTAVSSGQTITITTEPIMLEQ